MHVALLRHTLQCLLPDLSHTAKALLTWTWPISIAPALTPLST